jgi:hypothetical protein
LLCDMAMITLDFLLEGTKGYVQGCQVSLHYRGDKPLKVSSLLLESSLNSSVDHGESTRETSDTVPAIARVGAVIANAAAPAEAVVTSEVLAIRSMTTSVAGVFPTPLVLERSTGDNSVLSSSLLLQKGSKGPVNPGGRDIVTAKEVGGWRVLEVAQGMAV